MEHTESEGQATLQNNRPKTTYHPATWDGLAPDELSDITLPKELIPNFKKALASMRQYLIDMEPLDMQYENGTWCVNNLDYLATMKDISYILMDQIMGKDADHYDLLQDAVLMNLRVFALEWAHQYSMYLHWGYMLKMLPTKRSVAAATLLGVEGFKEPFIGKTFQSPIRRGVLTAENRLNKPEFQWFSYTDAPVSIDYALIERLKDTIHHISLHTAQGDDSKLVPVVKLKYDYFFGKDTISAHLPLSDSRQPVVFSPVELYLLRIAYAYLLERQLKICNRNGASHGSKFSMTGRTWKLCDPESIKLDTRLHWYMVENPSFTLPEKGNPYHFIVPGDQMTDIRAVMNID